MEKLEVQICRCTGKDLKVMPWNPHTYFLIVLIIMAPQKIIIIIPRSIPSNIGAELLWTGTAPQSHISWWLLYTQGLKDKDKKKKN